MTAPETNGGDRPQLDLGKPPGKLAKTQRRPGHGLLLLVVLLQVAVVALLVFRPGALVDPAGTGGTSGAEQVRAAAIELEDRGLDREAALEWERYLVAAPASPERARILFRIGESHFKGRRWEEAAAAFVRAERASDCDKELRAQIGPKMVDCLRNAGLYTEVGRELRRRTAADGAAGDGGSRVLARFAGETLTDADLDRRINFRIDRMLALQGAAADGASRAALHAQMTSPEMRRAIVQEVIRLELLSRRARDLGLDEGDDFRDSLLLAEKELLSTMLMEQEIGKIAVTAVDVESYFDAHREDYKDDESGEVPSFEEVADRVREDYRNRKRQEIMEGLLSDLMARYEVRIDDAAVAAPAPPPADPAAREETAGEDGAGEKAAGDSQEEKIQ